MTNMKNELTDRQIYQSASSEVELTDIELLMSTLCAVP